MMEYCLTNEESKRIGILKFICIILVVYIHSYNKGMNFSDESITLTLPMWLSIIEDVLSKGIAEMAVPMFFLISAILLFKREQNYKNLIIKKIRRLCIPYVFWNTFWIILFFTLQQVSFTKPFFSNPGNMIANYQLDDWLRAYGIGLYCKPFLYPLWFVRDLIIMQLLYPVFKVLINKLPNVALCISCVFILFPLQFPYSVAIGFFMLGGCVVRFNWRMQAIDKVSYVIICMFYCTIIIFNLFYSNFLLNQINILFGIIFFIKTSKYLSERKKFSAFLYEVVPYTYLIYVGHELILSCVKKVFLKILPHTPIFLFIQYLILPIFIITGCIAIGFILNRYTPKIYCFITGESKDKARV